MDLDHSKGFGSNSRGRIILLGDGSEVLTNSDNAEMLDHTEEDDDLKSQVSKTALPGTSSGATATKIDALPEKLETPPKAEYKGVTDEASDAAKKEDSKTS